MKIWLNNEDGSRYSENMQVYITELGLSVKHMSMIKTLCKSVYLILT